ncbi:MAG: hypothetical protein N2C14_20760 [Planctomycetales bacterium]
MADNVTGDADFPTPSSITKHAINLPGGKLKYRAAAEWITLRKVHQPIAQVFHTAYLAQSKSPGDRPLTFVFNGGPGAASAFLHLGAIGPQRVAFGPNGSLPQPPTQVIDNAETWLPFTDLVFIDPIGTGFSRALRAPKKKEESPKDSTTSESEADAPGDQENPEFWEIDRDLDSLGEFIRRFLSNHNRWTSPLFIAGESYGGFRVAKMARSLQEKHGVGLCGAQLISPAIEFDSLRGSDYNLTYWLELFPSLAAAAFHHGRAKNLSSDATLSSVIEQAESFAQNDLARWLAHGEALPQDDRARILATTSDLTGLPESILDRAEGRITSTLFCRELLRDQRRLCGHYDASVTAVDPFPNRNEYEGPDPTLFSIDRLFSGAVNHHLRANLKVKTDLDYRLLSMQVNESWKDAAKVGVFRKLAGAMDDLRYGMSLNEHMKVFITHGYFDLVTPYFSSRRLTRLMKLAPSQRKNLITENFRGGHMFYTWDESRTAFRASTERFYDSAVPGGLKWD